MEAKLHDIVIKYYTYTSHMKYKISYIIFFAGI